MAAPRSNWTSKRRASLLEPGAHRNAMLNEHPFINDEQELVTFAVQEIFNHVNECLTYNIPGLAMSAESRHGKSRCLDIIDTRLLSQLQIVAVVRIEARKIERPDKRLEEMLKDWLQEFHYPIHSRPTKTELREAVLTWLRTRAKRRLLIIIDEAQNYQVSEWAAIKEITNSLAVPKDDAVRTVVLSVFQGSIGPIFDKVKASRRDLVTRFFLRRLTLRGVSTLGDLEAVLKIFDDPELEEHPEGSNISFSEAFFPLAYASGWRFSKESRRLWSAMSSAWPKTVPKDIGMAALMGVLRRFVVTNLKHDGAKFLGDSAMWEEAVAQSDFRAYALNCVYKS